MEKEVPEETELRQLAQPESVPELIARSHEHVRRTPLERSLLRKADLVMIPIVSVVYLVTYLDRNCIGNAAIMGLVKDLHMSADQLYDCLMAFFIGYGITMLPASLSSRRLKPNRSLGVAITCFGLCLCAIFYACATVSGAFSGLIAYGVQMNLGSPAGRHAWSWLFLVEGVIAVGWGVVVFALLPRYPDDLFRRGKSHWLFTAEEIELAHRRYEASNIEREKFKWSEMAAILKDIKTYFFAFIQAAAILGVSVVGSFLPTFLHSFGFSALHSQLFTIIPYAFAFATVIMVGYISDRLNSKGPFLFVACCTGALGYLLLMVVSSTVGRVVATCLVTSACYPIAILCPAWMAINIPGFTRRGATWAFSELVGVAFSIMGTRIYTTPPRYIGGHGTVLALYLFAALNVAAAYFWMRHQNRKKDSTLEECARRGEVHPHIAARKTLEDLQDEHISFRYML